MEPFQFHQLSEQVELKYKGGTRGPASNFTPSGKLLICLFWLRNGFTYRFLSWLFEIPSLATVKQYLDDAKKCLLEILTPLVSFPAETRRNLAGSFYGGIVTLVIDGAEQEVYSSSDKDLSYTSFSGKKNYHTFSKLIGVSPNGGIMFVSKSFLGGMNDLNLVQMPENLKALKVDDDEFILADRGFRGMEKYNILTENTPTTFSSEPDYASKFRGIRVKVENGILWVKTWKACGMLYRVHPKKIQKALQKHHQMWSICCGLVNYVMFPSE